MPAGHGRVLFLGGIGGVNELAIAGEYLAQRYDRHVDAYDDYGHARKSILDGPRATAAATHFETPPTIHRRVRMHDGWPDLSDESRNLLFCCLAAGELEPLLTLPRRLFDGASLLGRHEHLAVLAKACRFRVMPIAQWEDWFVVKAHA